MHAAAPRCGLGARLRLSGAVLGRLLHASTPFVHCKAATQVGIKHCRSHWHGRLPWGMHRSPANMIGGLPATHALLQTHQGCSLPPLAAVPLAQQSWRNPGRP